MSEEFREFYYHDDVDQRRITTAAAPYSGSTFSPQMFDHSYLSYSEFFNGSTAQNPFFALSPEAVKEEEQPPTAAGGGGGETPATPNSSVSSGSAENDENSNKGKKGVKEEANDQISNKDDDISKKKKKGADQKKQRQPRFAFMTKSEVDHLEDGYRWRKYGQKAVKHSAYPRSYYRCTTQKCAVKKRVERSFEDPSIVVTTYEGHHNHHVPVTLRGSVTAGMFAPSLPLLGGPTSFSQELLGQMTTRLYGYGGDIGGTSNNNNNNDHHQQNLSAPRQQFNEFPDYGLLQDIIPPTHPKPS